MNIKKIFLLVAWLVLPIIACKENSKLSNEETKRAKLIGKQKKTQSLRTKANSPEEQLAGFILPDGFSIELVASERDGIINPIDLTFDDAGRLWTQTGKMYPLDPVADIKWKDLLALMNDPEAQEENPEFKRILDLYRGETKGVDQILILSNLYDNSPVKAEVWADGLALPQSILPYKNGSYVAQGSEMFFLDDTNNDGKADTRVPLLTGFGITDTHTMAHVLVRGPGNWIHFSQGGLNKGEVSSVVSNAKVNIDYSKIARFSLDGKKLEVLSSGLNNIWGFQLKANGQWWGTEANDLGYAAVPLETGVGFKGIGNVRIRPYQPWMPELFDFRVGGTGLSGLAFAEDSEGSFPKEWKNVAFLANPITSTINAVRVVRNEDGTVSGEHLPDLLYSEDDWFRPVNMEFGPDGCLYIADWYNKIVSHNELPTTHPDRDKSHGRIWRIRHESQKLREIPNFYKVETKNLVDYLKSPSIWEKRAAWHQISDRSAKEVQELAPDLVTLALDKTQDEATRIVALWSLEAIHHFDKKIIDTFLESSKHTMRKEVIRSLTSFSLSADELANILEEFIEDSSPMVRSQVIRTLDEVGVANSRTIELLVRACKPELGGNDMGGPYERKLERYLARKTLENYPNQLYDYITSSEADKIPETNLIWASQALPTTQKESVFVALWEQSDIKKLDEPTFILIANMLTNKEVFSTVKPVLEAAENAVENVSFTLENLGRVQSDELTSLLVKPIQNLLQSPEESHQLLGLEAVGKLGINKLRSSVVSLIKDGSSDVTIELVMKALEDDSERNKELFEKLAKKEELSAELRVLAIRTIAKTDQFLASAILDAWLPKLDQVLQKQVISQLSKSNHGSLVLRKSFKNGLLDIEAFDLSSAERIYNLNTNDETGVEIMEAAKKQAEKEEKNFASKLEHFMSIAEKSTGNPSNGEQLFQVCLQCHRVGDKGYDFAPALDGSASRENEALLTAILNPDAAVENAFSLYRVVTKSGSNVEGFLVRNDSRGVTLGFMGGGETFIQSDDIRLSGHLGGRSFMPKGLIDNYSEEQVSDLLAYIRTLN
ncbi:PVC-type heme-binding CxxCH protein [Arenibacter sp. ARW7G5Y1]|uniref:PVC-type heme-binding CxxCH protein n=1 Tax=Arenibacter sp. ARW7G5Y1 TaxID=2135619 RepID=UPI000D755B7D|nr:PVC-type heme-binding CxxCH protein [Arenibacter sp. ARW7G5Y1]PXX21489.1 putative membrane-bound dehydrogenase-like protein [Arenibacter sp. ARW7G5Y1]